jgi:hypothetical protein
MRRPETQFPYSDEQNVVDGGVPSVKWILVFLYIRKDMLEQFTAEKDKRQPQGRHTETPLALSAMNASRREIQRAANWIANRKPPHDSAA